MKGEKANVNRSMDFNRDSCCSRRCDRWFLYRTSYNDELLCRKPTIDEDMIRSMMTQMGQKPSEQKVRQIAASMKAQAKKRAKK